MQARLRPALGSVLAIALLGAVLGAQTQQTPQKPPQKPAGESTPSTPAGQGTPAAGKQAPSTDQSTPKSNQPFTVRVDLVTTDVIVRDGNGQFVADLTKDDFEVFEDDVKQELVSFTLTHGGRIFNVAAPPPPVAEEGIILPASRPTNDAAGRIFLLFVDDLHLDFRNTPRRRN
jgi:hypothetical protein